MLHWVYSKRGFLLKLDIDRIVHLLPEFAEAVHASGAPMTRVWGFVDDTVRSVTRWTTGGFRVDVAYLTSDKYRTGPLIRNTYFEQGLNLIAPADASAIS